MTSLQDERTDTLTSLAAGMIPEPNISTFLNSRISAGDFPSAVYLVGEKGQVVFSDAVGHSVVEPYRISVTYDTIYDLASLTKPLVTALLCMMRVERGELTLDSAMAQYLPEFDRADKHSITIGHLLTHTSGLPAWRPLYILAQSERDRTLGVIAQEPLQHPPGTQVLYSDLGFITLGLLLEKLTGKPLATLAAREIFDSLKLEHTFFNPDIALQTGIAACETGNAYERESCRSAGLEDYSNWRERLIWGEVHDGNASFLSGAAGHAGLFSTASETFVMAQQFLAERSSLLKPEICGLFRVNMTEGLGEARSPGWQLAATPASTAGSALPGDSFGHNGFTGTSCWIDAQHDRVFILLTNRTHNRPLPFANINSVRREFHKLAVAGLG